MATDATTWWGYAQGDEAIIAAVVVVFVLAAVGFVAGRVFRRRQRGR